MKQYSFQGHDKFVLMVTKGPAQLSHVLFCDVAKQNTHRTQEETQQSRLWDAQAGATGLGRKPTSPFPPTAHCPFSPGMSLAHIQIKCQLERAARSLSLGR